MNAWQRFEELAQLARREPIPPIDVRGRVLAAINKQRVVIERPDQNWPLAILAGLSLVAATVMAALTLNAWSLLAELPAGILQPLSWVLS